MGGLHPGGGGRGMAHGAGRAARGEIGVAALLGESRGWLGGRPRVEPGAGIVVIGVVIGPSHLERIAAQRMGHMIEHPLDPQHALRPAEATIGGGALHIGLEPVAFDPQRRDVIGVVRVQHGAVGHRDRQILRPAAAGILQEIHRQQLALVIEPGAVINAEIMALAGDHHVVVAVIAHLGRPARRGGHHRAGDGQRVALALLAAKTAAHAPGFDPHGVHRQVQRMRHLVLDLGRVLGRAVHQQIAVFLRQRQRRLPFEIEMLLPAHLERAFDHVGRRLQRLRRIALFPDARAVLETGIGGERRVDAEDGLACLVGDMRLAHRLARGKVTGRGDQKHRLTDIVQRAVRQQRLVMQRGRAIAVRGQILRPPDAHHARRASHIGKVDFGDMARRDLREAKGQMQAARRHGNIVDIARLAGHMQRRRIMRQGSGDAHGRTSRTLVAAPRSSSR